MLSTFSNTTFYSVDASAKTSITTLLTANTSKRRGAQACPQIQCSTTWAKQQYNALSCKLYNKVNRLNPIYAISNYTIKNVLQEIKKVRWCAKAISGHCQMSFIKNSHVLLFVRYGVANIVVTFIGSV